MLLVMVPVGMMAGFLVSAVVTYLMPKKYESQAIIEVKPRTREDSGRLIPSNNSDKIEIACGTEFEIIKSRNSLSKVIDSLDLINRWGMDRETALQILKKVVVTENIKGTDLIEISVRHTNKEDARDLAAEVARSYRDYRKELESNSLKKGISELKKAVREQEDRVEATRKILTIIARNKGEAGGADPVDRQDFTDAKREFETELSLLEQLKLKLITEEISLGTSGDTVVVHEDPVIADVPVSPNVTLNLVIGALGGVLISPFLALPLMWWMSQRKR